MSGGFDRNTRNKVVRLQTLTKPTGGGITTLELPKTGFLARLWLRINATASGTITSPNPLGASSIIRRVRLSTNSGIDIFSVSGPGYAYLLDELLESEFHRGQSQNEGRTAVSAASFNLDMVIPVQVNLRDPIGLVMLQNEQLQVILTVDWEADANVGTGATVTATCDPYLEYYTVPIDPEDYPPLNVIHQIQEDTMLVAGAGDTIYNVLRGATYLQMAHGLGIGVSGADGFSRCVLRMNQSDTIYDVTPDFLTMQSRLLRGRARVPGTIPFDFMASSGLGTYGLPRDLINSALVTDFQSVITATGAGTLYTLRRMLLPLG